ncbi:ferric reduction oxidase 8 [Musa troglodytarum]|uniref:Ferric reduction oxidase 8 n=1 Tax=Musa troglodytarum TaxID=320322 RepID=A0A9E7GDF9_9LILI|nr:ferric reduction oxidase 8 [Musa troglodytarum]
MTATTQQITTFCILGCILARPHRTTSPPEESDGRPWSPPTGIHRIRGGSRCHHPQHRRSPRSMARNTTLLLLLVLKLFMAVLLAAWACIWIIRPTQSWKRSWHVGEDRASATFVGDYGLTVVVYCLPVLAVATLGYISLHIAAKKDALRMRRPLMPAFTNPLIVSSPVGVLSAAELLAAAFFIVFLAWTYYSNVSSDFKKMTPYQSLKLNRWQLKMMHLGVRIGSLSEACLLLLFLPILRGMAVFRILGVQYEASVRYHIWIGNTMILLSALHGISIMFIWATKNRLFKEARRVNIAGAIALATGVIIWITSLPQVRRKQFQLFFSAHHLYIVFILFFLIHAGDRHFYLVFAGVLLFALDKILRIIQSRKQTFLVSASILPCRAVKLTLPKLPCMDYTPTSIIFIKVPGISKFQWHPFSITSSSNMDDSELSVLIKCHGQWTTDLYNMLNSMTDAGSDHPKSIPVAVEGPYGPATVEHLRYRSLVLIAGGSGISPLMSILQDIASRNGGMERSPTKVHLIYAVKKVQDLSMLALISPLLLTHSAELGNLHLKLFVTEEDGPPFTAEKMLQDLSRVKTITMNKASPEGTAVPTPEGLLWKAAMTALSLLLFLASLIILTHLFVHQEKKSSKKKNPSWIGDLLLLCSFAIAASCCTVATVLSRWRKSVDDSPELSYKHHELAEMLPDKVQGALQKHEIYFGCRPNLGDMLAEIATGTGDSEVGVFVSGPTSMQKAVASFCTRHNKRLKTDERKLKCSFNVHFITFSL